MNCFTAQKCILVQNQVTQDLSVARVKAGIVIIFGWIKPRQAQEQLLGEHLAETLSF
jgi:hypothetical protein